MIRFSPPSPPNLSHASFSVLPAFLSPSCSASANAEAAAFRTDSAIKALKARYAAESESYAALKQALNLTNDELLAYVWIEATKERNAEFVSGRRATTFAVSTPSGLEKGA